MWEIDIDADTPEEAARQAQEIQRDPESTATVFRVRERGSNLATSVDLSPEENKPEAPSPG
jgi:hypothetical protein